MPEPQSSDPKPADTPSVVSKAEPPDLTFKNVMRDIWEGIYALLYTPFYIRLVAPILVLGESVAVKAIIARVPYTEIDFKAYMQQIAQIKAGELDYAYIFGDTGALVYPAGHVQIYYYLIDFLTYHGENVIMGQKFFGWVYVMTYALCVVVYAMADMPPWTVMMLVLSKRLHSIYVLRMFNDCFTTLAMVLCVFFLQQAASYKKQTRVSSLLTYSASIVFSFAVSIKMNALLYLPGFFVVLYLLTDEVFSTLMCHLGVMAATQIAIAWSFLQPLTYTPAAHAIRMNYLAGAYDFSRQFLYKWTVNWKFVLEDLFLDHRFGFALLLIQVVFLLVFIFSQAVTHKTLGKSVSQTVRDFFRIATPTLSPTAIINDPSRAPRFVVFVMVFSNLIGVLCARSLHYQFLSWYAWLLPLLLSLTGVGMFVSTGLWLLHEWCWNVFPATAVSSGTLIVILAFVVGAVWKRGDAIFQMTVDEEKKDQ
ncbi:glycosyltransferase family 58 protein [Babjeviella inositovora NRRL Y-12698]|uniref:Dol-P-Man:Man(5)GlcNAc(2)-PP-Dol alpha-1,3-mannosyltransferase n=1 Tax=Babjeviella inositovora NRRL Y-12698 TaxID=984486 RepID=A0A1E3QKG2_9ASCO|nr:glycosyltransferase family 58 protein [Babjeviella inositovora NRRL Y-12698]ODQ78189.1 glycosyltransferase family 58 protein [Babjeviella inositovora NRRL Y-12698]